MGTPSLFLRKPQIPIIFNNLSTPLSKRKSEIFLFGVCPMSFFWYYQKRVRPSEPESDILLQILLVDWVYSQEF
jgi:hypothetical protein